MKIIGLTGPMGAGKSAALAMLKNLGAETLRADDASRELLSGDARLLSEIRQALGDGVFREDGTLDRARTAALVFSDGAAREHLEAIMHPPMVEWLRRRLVELRERDPAPALVVVEAAILTHMGAWGLVDAVVRVEAPREVCLARLQARDGVTREEAAARMKVHEALGLFTEAADYVLDSSGTLEETRERVEAGLREMMNAE